MLPLCEGCGTFKIWWSDWELFSKLLCGEGKAVSERHKKWQLSCELLSWLGWAGWFMSNWELILYTLLDRDETFRGTGTWVSKDAWLAPVAPGGYSLGRGWVLWPESSSDHATALMQCFFPSSLSQTQSRILQDWVFLSLQTCLVARIWKVYSCWNINYLSPKYLNQSSYWFKTGKKL